MGRPPSEVPEEGGDPISRLITEIGRAARAGWAPTARMIALLAVAAAARKGRQGRKAVIRQAVTSLTIAAYTVIAELAALGAPVDDRRAALFMIAGLLVGATALVASPY
jgi:hypothetical protein